MPLTAQIRRFVALPHFDRDAPGGFDFHWDVMAAGFIPHFQLQGREAEGEGWQDLLPSPIAEPFAAGVAPKSLSFQGDAHFRLLVLDAADDETVRASSNPIDARYQMRRRDWLFYREMLRRERLHMEKLTGLPGWLLRRIVNGPRCAECVNEITGEAMSSECPECFGTGFDGGYYDAFPLWASWDDAPPGGDATGREGSGPRELHPATAVIPAFPSAKYEDILVDRGTGMRYSVDRSESIAFRSAPVKQKLTLSRLQPAHPAYGVPIPELS
jgi:hypothetical protein